MSDGTLRFLALAALALDPEFGGLLCMEEPENGIHPSRIPQMLSLVRSLSEDIESDGEGARIPSIRQLIVNTHSPLVVAELRDDELLFAETLKMKGKTFVNFKPLSDTWRQNIAGSKGAELITRGEMMSYLSGQKQANRSNGSTPLVGRLSRSIGTTPDLFQQQAKP